MDNWDYGGSLLRSTPMYAVLGLAILELATQDPLPAPPATVKRVAACTAAARLVTSVVKLGGFDVATLRDCASTDQEMYLLLHRGDTWWMADSVTVRYRAANTTDAPLRIRMIKRDITQGTLADGTKVAVLRVDTLHEAPARSLHQAVALCTLPAAEDDRIACHTTSLACRGDCDAVSLRDGVLSLDGKPAFEVTVAD